MVMEDEALTTIIDRLTAIINSPDTEAAHIDADIELRRAIEILGEMSGKSTLARVIVETYNNVPKWYA